MSSDEYSISSLSSNDNFVVILAYFAVEGANYVSTEQAAVEYLTDHAARNRIPRQQVELNNL